MVDLTFQAARDTSKEEDRSVLEEASEGRLKDILGFNREPLVSIDFNHDPRSSVYEASLTRGGREPARQGAAPGTTTNGVSRTACSIRRSRS
jgi:glyceraldehyde-3-phosphate dehydrogenase/erythrose-4-phosphate dehydrogenase